MLFKHIFLSVALGLALAACHSAPTAETAETGAATAADRLALPEPDASGLPGGLKPGPWRGELLAQGQRIPFLFNVATAGDGKAVVELINHGLNGEERLRCDEITAGGDSAVIKMHVFDAALVVRPDGEGKLKGTWVKYDTKEPYRVPLVAMRGAQDLFRRSQASGNHSSFKGNWQVNFTDSNGESYPAGGVFAQNGTDFTGTFLTSTGDYRYLSGQLTTAGMGLQYTDSLCLATFDGSHAFLFKITYEGENDDGRSRLKGEFYSGKSGHETFDAIRFSRFVLPLADTLTYLKKGESRLNFRFPSIAGGGSISPTNAKYRGKVVVVQLLGSWCPNCLDESNFLAPWYEKNKQRGVEVIGLGYERSPDYDQAAARLRTLRERLHIGYDLAVAGVSNKDSVAQSLPQLAKFLAFPTTIFLDKKGNVRKIRTGYSGPGTGPYYAQETAAFEREVNKLLAE